jgi:hypothetical protein
MRLGRKPDYAHSSSLQIYFFYSAQEYSLSGYLSVGEDNPDQSYFSNLEALIVLKRL